MKHTIKPTMKKWTLSEIFILSVISIFTVILIIIAIQL
jgi:hypothetical protein